MDAGPEKPAKLRVALGSVNGDPYAHPTDTLQGKHAFAPTQPKTGEAWEVADLPEGTSTVVGGPLDGKTLSELVQQHRTELCGRYHVNGRFPLLVKLVLPNTATLPWFSLMLRVAGTVAPKEDGIKSTVPWMVPAFCKLRLVFLTLSVPVGPCA